MFNVTFSDGSSWRKQLVFTALHAALVGFGMGIGVTAAVFVAAHFGWIPSP